MLEIFKDVIKIRQVICKCHKTKIAKDGAYCIKINNKNQYWCNKEEYDNNKKEQLAKDSLYKTVAEILQIPIVTPFMKKEIEKIRVYYEYDIIRKTFIESEPKLNWFIRNKMDERTTEFAMFRYCITVIANNINDVKSRYIKELKALEDMFKSNTENDIIDDMILNNNESVDRNVSDISQFLD